MKNSLFDAIEHVESLNSDVSNKLTTLSYIRSSLTVQKKHKDSIDKLINLGFEFVTIEEYKKTILSKIKSLQDNKKNISKAKIIEAEDLVKILKKAEDDYKETFDVFSFTQIKYNIKVHPRTALTLIPLTKTIIVNHI